MDLMIFSRRRKESKMVLTLGEIDKIVNWMALVNIAGIVDKSKTQRGGRKPFSIEGKLRMLFLQFLYNLSDQELEDQLIDRMSFQKFVGIALDEEIPDFVTLWRFKETLIKHNLMNRIFSSIIKQLELKGLLIKKGTAVDATIIKSSNKPLSKEQRIRLEKNPSSQIDTDAKSTEKNKKKYFGYKGHIGLDIESKIIRKRSFTAANVHDSQKMDDCLSGDEKAVFADKAYVNRKRKTAARALGIYYGVLDKGKLSKRKQKRNQMLSRIRAAVEHPFAFIKNKLKYHKARAKNLARNALVFDMNCIIYNVLRASFLLKRQLA